MPRVPYLSPAEADGEVREALEAVPKNIVRLIAQAQGVAPQVLGLIGGMLTGLALADRLREIAILEVARQSGAEYEWTQHVPIARRAGVSAEQLAALERGEHAVAVFSEAERATLAFVDELLAGPRPSDAIFARLLAAGYGPRETVELVLLVGCYEMLARVMTALDIEVDEVVSAAELAATMDFINR